ncbi:MAG: amidohydrolase family protein [Chloroflexi bacterium]|nr:amidohydrolase family protein [Chloroflexota bacterium]
MIVDMENHIRLPREDNPAFKSGKITERFWSKTGEVGFRISNEGSNVQRFLQFMDEAGIDMAVLTCQRISTFDEMQEWHNYAAKLMIKYPKRFYCLATISPLGGKSVLHELERAIKDLGLKGVHIHTNNDDKPLDSKEMWPFYEKVSELNIPVDVHITSSPGGFDALKTSYALYYVAAREFDMAMSVLRICFGGVLEDFPELKLIMNHFGGGVSSILDRFDAYTKFADEPGWAGFYFDKPLISRPYREYFNKLYFNMAGREIGMAAVKCALTNISPRKLLFGTDWPLNYDYNPQGVKEYINEIRKLDLPQEDIEAMLGGNALQLLA